MRGHSLEVIIKNNMKLRSGVAGEGIMDEDNIATVDHGVTHINAEPCARIPLGGCGVAVL